MTAFLAISLAVCALSGCRTNKDAAVPLVRVHAEKDLRCPSDQVRVSSQLGGRYTAMGCGRSVVYNTACQALRCAVFKEGEDAPGWRDRPDPGTDFTR